MDHETTTASRSMGRRGRSETREVIVIAWRERERRSSRFSPIVPPGGRAVEMATRWRSTEAVGGALIGRWFRT
jgi:hypothetical protein